ncbi:MAG: mannose-1-phosphate guanylyltransferase/mannose-6-phosphate isomerase [Desulfobacteraceae bacterium]|nr:MAG: mannose-1-phosphate guanylyltransferase/mannose-6-phosphate isomerase [Desulfobacteraceae bacterium]
MLHAVILTGGSGTRFWPLSREKMPKQLLHILGDQSMLAMTLERAVALVPEERIWAVTTRSQAGEIKLELHTHNFKKVRVLEEPAGRNTAAAIGLAAIRILREDPAGVLAVLPADHHIEQKDRFLDLLRAGQKVAEEGWLVTLGISPTRPETGYGYIKKGRRIDSLELGNPQPDVFQVSRFTEKPDQETAETYLQSGDFFWNSGIFLWRADHIMDEMKRYLPAHYKGLMEIDSLGDPPSDPDRVADIYEGLATISVDYGIMERSDRVAMLPSDVGWSDVGSWAALLEIMEKDPQGNVVKGDVLISDSRNSLLYGRDRLVAAIGLDGVVAVDTPDALLICRANASQNVGKVVEQLRNEGREEALVHREVLKPWGAYKVLDRGETYQLKWLDVLPGERLSLQSHQHRAEHWIVVAGTAAVTVDKRVVDVVSGEHIHIPKGSRHRVENRKSEKLRMIEIQTGDYLGEDDIVRYEDDYGRIS